MAQFVARKYQGFGHHGNVYSLVTFNGWNPRDVEYSWEIRISRTNAR